MLLTKRLKALVGRGSLDLDDVGLLETALSSTKGSRYEFSDGSNLVTVGRKDLATPLKGNLDKVAIIEEIRENKKLFSDMQLEIVNIILDYNKGLRK